MVGGDWDLGIIRAIFGSSNKPSKKPWTAAAARCVISMPSGVLADLCRDSGMSAGDYCNDCEHKNECRDRQ